MNNYVKHQADNGACVFCTTTLHMIGGDTAFIHDKLYKIIDESQNGLLILESETSDNHIISETDKWFNCFIVKRRVLIEKTHRYGQE